MRLFEDGDVYPIRVLRASIIDELYKFSID
jgi:hypothetical protein